MGGNGRKMLFSLVTKGEKNEIGSFALTSLLFELCLFSDPSGH